LRFRIRVGPSTGTVPSKWRPWRFISLGPFSFRNKRQYFALWSRCCFPIAPAARDRPQFVVLGSFFVKACVVSWSRQFEEPIELPDGRRLKTLAEAMAWLAKESEHKMEKRPISGLRADDLVRPR